MTSVTNHANNTKSTHHLHSAFRAPGVPFHAILSSLLLFISLTISAQQLSLDFGDAPKPYPTLLDQDGARHPLSRSFFLGKLADAEPDGTPEANALGDDRLPAEAPDDEDGVLFPIQPLTPGQTVTILVNLTGTEGHLDAWIDFNQDGDWFDSGEQIFRSQPLASDINSLRFTVPTAATPGNTFARFRLSLRGGLKPNGIASDGEVEDYQVNIDQPVQRLDFGDAPEKYPTLLSQDGARHQPLQGFNLGRFIDVEPDGQPNATATGDDAVPAGATLPDDEDGVAFPAGALRPGAINQVEIVLSSGEGHLDAWIDFNADGDWADPGEQIFTAKLITAGINTLPFSVPADAKPGETFSRFRLSLKGGLPVTGLAPDGEVEDHLVKIEIPVEGLDFGDAPRPYPTLLTVDGARHRPVQGFHLGKLIDIEPDGQPNATATGDDINPSLRLDDEDGVRFATNPLLPGRSAQVEVIVSAGDGKLDGWVDFNRDGDWADDGEKIFNAQPLAPGLNTLTVAVPSTALPGPSFSRFRLSFEGGLNFTGPSPDGEVEDYPIAIDRGGRDCEPRTNKGTDFWVTFPGNYAPDPANPVNLTLCIVGTPGTTGSVEIPGLSFSTTFTIPASMEAVIHLPRAAELGNAIDLVEDKGIHVTANDEVAVYGLNRVFFTSDGYLAYPTDVLGQRYLVQSFSNEHTGAPDLNGTQFAFVTTEDGTTVAIAPSVNTAGHPAFVPYTVTLNKGQTYQLRNTNDAPNDLSGTLILADKPIALFGSHQCSNIPDDTTWFCDYLVEQLLPVERAGSRFLTMPLATRTSGDTYRFWALANNTLILVNGVPVAFLNAGQMHEQTISAPSQILSSKPILAALYSNSSDFDLVQNSDPFMIALPHTGQFLKQYMVCTPDAGFNAHYINIVAPDAVVGSLSLDGVPVAAASFTPIPGSGFSGAQITVAPGAHNLAATQPFGVILYGWSLYDSYGYPGGLFFGDTQPPVLECPEEPITVTLNPGATTTAAPCFAVVPDLRDRVKVSDNCGLPDRVIIQQSPAPGTTVGPGQHPIILSTTDANGNIGYCIVEFIVIDPTPLQIVCPSDMTVRCRNSEGAIVRFEAIARKRCDTNFEPTCSPPSGSLFPVGTTTVTCTATDHDGTTVSCTFTVTVTCGPRLDFTLTAGGRLSLSWSGDQVLETASSVTGPWTVVAGAQSPFTAELTGRQGYYRLRSR